MSYALNQTFTSTTSPAKKEGRFHLTQTLVLWEGSIFSGRWATLVLITLITQLTTIKVLSPRKARPASSQMLQVGAKENAKKESGRKGSEIPSNLKFLEKFQSNFDSGVYFSRLGEDVNTIFEVWHECLCTAIGSNPEGKVSVQGWKETSLLFGQRASTKLFCE